MAANGKPERNAGPKMRAREATRNDVDALRVAAGPMQPVANDEAPLGDKPDGLEV